MIRYLLTFKLSIRAALRGLPDFIAAYMRSRRLRMILPALPAVLLTGFLLSTLHHSSAPEWRSELQQRFDDRCRQALADGDLKSAEFSFSRLMSMTNDPVRQTFNFASQLYEQSRISREPSLTWTTADPDFAVQDPWGHRALSLLQSIAPRQGTLPGHPEAHLLLAEHWQSRQPETAVTRLHVLQHRYRGRPGDTASALELARFLSEHQYHQHAVEVLLPLQQENAQVQLALVAGYNRLQDHRTARRFLKSAIDLLQRQIDEVPQDAAVRIRLSQALAADDQLLTSMLVLAEGCRTSGHENLADLLIERYSIWLSLMSPQKVRRQLNDIQLALHPQQPTPADSESYPLRTLTLSGGVSVELPEPIEQFHQALINGEGRWLVPLLLGTDHASLGEYETAVELLTEAIREKPDHPVAANNLAWTLLQLHSTSDRKHLPADRDDRRKLETAWQYANIAVAECPGRVSFRETRGMVAAATGHWQVAFNDLQTCSDAGMQSVEVQTRLTQAWRNSATMFKE
ncbi:MAG: hypothetical protein R3C49_19155 [Planctomycetaceae bacterium]